MLDARLLVPREKCTLSGLEPSKPIQLLRLAEKSPDTAAVGDTITPVQPGHVDAQRPWNDGYRRPRSAPGQASAGMTHLFVGDDRGANVGLTGQQCACHRGPVWNRANRCSFDWREKSPDSCSLGHDRQRRVCRLPTWFSSKEGSHPGACPGPFLNEADAPGTMDTGDKRV